MTTTSRFPKLACGIAFAASILTGINAQAQHRGQMHVPPPHPSVRPNQPPAAGLTDFGSGGNTQALGRSAPPTWVGSAAPSNPGAYFQPPQQGYNNPQIPQGYYQQPQQNYYQPPQQGYYQPPQGYYQPPQQGYDPQIQQTSMAGGGGQQYQLPAGYAAYGPGTTINYGGANYVIGGDGTMTPAAGGYQQQAAVSQPTAPQRYQIPAGYEAYGPGTTISYGGANYVVGGDGTMAASAGGSQGVFQPTAPQRYQIPAGYEAYGPGTIINYGGANYVIGGDGTMSPN